LLNMFKVRNQKMRWLPYDYSLSRNLIVRLISEK